jgi:uncharacterized tellurite resistance protein B-like protein
MLLKIEQFLIDLVSEKEPRKLDEVQLRIASAALLVHCARADGHQSSDEKTRLRTLMKERFDLPSEEIEAIIATAEQQEREAIDLHRFTRILHKHLDRDECKRMVQLLWEMADADGKIDNDERQIVSLTAHLLGVEVQDSVAARQAAVAKRKGQ